MFSPACAEFIIGAPVIAIEALTELRDLLVVLRATPRCDMASLKPVLTEVKNEGLSEVTTSTVQPAAVRSRASRIAKGQERAARPGTGRIVAERSQRKPRSKRKKGSDR
jgi:hypothetical protein